PFAVRSGEPPFLAVAGERGDVRSRMRVSRGLRRDRRQRNKQGEYGGKAGLQARTTTLHFLLGFLGGAFLIAASAFSWFHCARNSCPADPPDRADVHASWRPSGEGTGRPSNPSEYVTRTGSFVPAASTMNSSKFSNPSLFDAKMTYSPDGCMYGAQLIDPKSVICRWFVPSGFII